MKRKKTFRGGSRPGAGRPREMDTATRLVTLVPQELVYELEALAGKRGIPRARLVRELLQEGLVREPR